MQHQIHGFSKTVIHTKEVKNRQEEYRKSLKILTQPIDEHLIVQQCLQNFIEDEWTQICVKINNNDYFKLESYQVAEMEEGQENDDDDEKDPNKSLKLVRYVFGILQKDTFSLFKDLHMETKIKNFDVRNIEFSDMGTCLFNEEKQEKYYFIKMIHRNIETETRDLYILAFSEAQIQKWDNSLHL